MITGGHVDALTTYGFLLYLAFNDYGNAEASPKPSTLNPQH